MYYVQQPIKHLLYTETIQDLGPIMRYSEK